MRVIQVVPSVADEANGPSYSVLRLCRALGEASNDVLLMTVGSPIATHFSGFAYTSCRHDFVAAPVVSRLWISKDLARALDAQTAEADIIHNHGLWLMPNIYPARASAKHRKPFVVSPRGTLAKHALQFSPHAKRFFWLLLQGRAMRGAACFHATSEQEYRDIRRAGLRQPVAVIPNGIDIPAVGKTISAAPEMRTLLYLGRLHPIKGIDSLLQAWSRVAEAAPDWRLRIVGPDGRGYRAQLERLARELGVSRVEFAGPRYGRDKAAEYVGAELCILPSHAENFGMSIAEALAHGTPVIATTGTPWAGVGANGCGWYVDTNAQALEAALREALMLEPLLLASMGQAGRSWMARDFSWLAIGGRMEAVYRWLLEGGPPPETVRLN